MTAHPRLRRLRKPYLASLWLLQVALAWRVLPEISRGLEALLPIGSAADPLTRMTQVALAACAAVGVAACLGLPSVAAMLHGRAGPDGNGPRAARPLHVGPLGVASVGVALAGGAAFAFGTAIEVAVPHVARLDVLAGTPAPAIVVTGIVLMTAGGLATEVLCRTRPDRPGSAPPSPDRRGRDVRPAAPE